jgi:hypothetical protein
MIYIYNYVSFNEGKYPDNKKVSPISSGQTNGVIRTKPAIEVGVVLILTNPFPDKLRRVYMALIDRVREDNLSDTVRVDLIPQYYILKQYQDGRIFPEKIEILTPRKRFDILGMKTNGLYLNENKTPLWQISSCMSKVTFFGRHQDIIANLKEEYKDIIFPFTQSTKPPSLH